MPSDLIRGWTPVRRQEYAPTNESRVHSDSVGTECALVRVGSYAPQGAAPPAQNRSHAVLGRRWVCLPASIRAAEIGEAFPETLPGLSCRRWIGERDIGSALLFRLPSRARSA